MYGWEADVDRLYMKTYNQLLFKQGLLTKEEFDIIDRAIMNAPK